MVPRIRSWMICTAAGIWLASAFLSAWAGGRGGLAWDYLGALSGTVAGAAFAASGLGLVTQRWQRREFLRRGRSIALMTLDLIQIRLGEVARLGVATIAPAFPVLRLFPLDVEGAAHIPYSNAHARLLEAAEGDARRVEGALGRARLDLESEVKPGQDPPLPPEPLRVDLEPYEVPDISGDEILDVAQAILDAAGKPKVTEACEDLTHALSDLGPYLGVDDLVWEITEKAYKLTNLGAKTGRGWQTVSASLREARDGDESPSANSLRLEVETLAAAEKQARAVQELLALVRDLLGDLAKASEDVARRPRWRAPWESTWARQALDRLAVLENEQQQTDVGVVGIEFGLMTKQLIESGRASVRRSEAERARRRKLSQARRAHDVDDNALACRLYRECDNAGELDALNLLAYATALAARSDEEGCLKMAERSVAAARTEQPELLRAPWFALRLSRCYAINGDAERVVSLLRSVTDEEWLSHLPQTVESDSAFDEIRTEPVFVAFLDEVGREATNPRAPGQGTLE